MYIAEALKKKKGKVKLKGWVYRIRKGKEVIFIILRDANGVIQCTIDKSHPQFREADRILVESSLEIEGIVKPDKRAVHGVEVKISKLRVIHLAETFPITRDKSTEHLMDYRHLWIRSRELTARLRIRDKAFEAVRKYFRSKGFFETTCPMFVGTRGEEGSELFETDYFGRTAYLTQTSQFHLEAQIFALEKVFTIAPSFRNEKSKTRKHVTEFWHVEAEEAWCDLDGTMRTQEELVSFIAQYLAKHCVEDLKLVGQDPAYLKSIKPPFRRITYSEAVKTLQKKGSRIRWGEDIKTEDELLLMKDESKPVFVTHWPRKLKTFYMEVDPKDKRLVLCADLQAPFGYGEIIGGSERSTSVKELVKRLKEDGDDPKKYDWYLDLRRYGSVQHAGFGLGLARLLAWMTKAGHIRDVIPFPRFVNRLSP